MFIFCYQLVLNDWELWNSLSNLYSKMWHDAEQNVLCSFTNPILTNMTDYTSFVVFKSIVFENNLILHNYSPQMWHA